MFLVEWSGNDESSGVGDFTIFVADNGGAYTTWLTNTTDMRPGGQPGAREDFGRYDDNCCF